MTKIERRAALLHAVRGYFRASDVLEVTTPLLRAYGVTDPHLTNLAVGQEGYLQTSPEYAMKMLLAEHGRSIFQICPAFRGGESGNRHQLEFQMLEWYRVGFSLAALMNDLGLLLNAVGAEAESKVFDEPPRQIAYSALFESRYQLNPHQASLDALMSCCRQAGGGHLDEKSDKADCLDYLFSLIEPTLLQPTIVYDFPVCQAALAETGTDTSGNAVSFRFELYAEGLELANAYQELCQANELRARFIANNERRRELGLPEMALDEEFLSIAGEIPACSGIALGIERLMMALTGKTDMKQV